MTGVSIDTLDDEVPVRSDEPGTAPGDRRFAPMSKDSGRSPLCWWFSTTVD